MKKRILTSCMLAIYVLTMITNVVYAVSYYPECSSLPRYDALLGGNYNYGRDERQILNLENGKQAYSFLSSTYSGQEYISKLVNEYGWKRVTSSSKNSTGYNVLCKDNKYVGIAVFYGQQSSPDGVRIYPNVNQNPSNEEPIFYNEFPELPMFSLVSSCQYQYKFITPSNTYGFAYGEPNGAHYESIISYAYGWEFDDYVYDSIKSFYAKTYKKNGIKICIAHMNKNVYVFECKEELDAAEVINYINYGRQHQVPINASLETAKDSAQRNTFSDFDSSHWAYDFVQKMVNKGIVTGYPDGTFRPEAAVTRAEFCVMLSKIAELSIDSANTGSKHWSYPYMVAIEDNTWTYANWYLKEYKPDVAINRGEAAMGLCDIYLGYPISLIHKADKVDAYIASTYKDAPNIGGFAEVVYVMTTNKLMTGYEDGCFHAEYLITRAEMCAILARAFLNDELSNKQNKIEVDPIEQIQQYILDNGTFYDGMYYVRNVYEKLGISFSLCSARTKKQIGIIGTQNINSSTTTITAINVNDTEPCECIFQNIYDNKMEVFSRGRIYPNMLTKNAKINMYSYDVFIDGVNKTKTMSYSSLNEQKELTKNAFSSIVYTYILLFDDYLQENFGLTVEDLGFTNIKN